MDMTFDGIFAEATIDGEGRKTETIRNVLLCGLQSLNGRSIPASAFGGEAQAKALYECCHVYLNHDMENGPSRKIQELAGTVANVRIDNLGRPRGDILLGDNRAAEELRALVKFGEKATKHGTRLKDVGMSHVARYTFSSHDRSTVQSVDEVFSVDVVIRPATTKSFSESSMAPVPVEKTPAEFLEALGIDLQTWRETPIEYAFGEAPTSEERPDSGEQFDPAKALDAINGGSAESSEALETVSFI